MKAMSIAKWLLLAGLLSSLGACMPNADQGDFQRIQLAFDLDRTLAADEAEIVLTTGFPSSVDLDKQFVGLSGQLVPPGAANLPSRVNVTGEVEASAGNKAAQRVVLKLKVGGDGTFSGRKKIKKDVDAGDLLTVEVQPQGAPIPAGTRVVLCLDVAATKQELNGLPDCPGVGGGGGNGGGGGGNAPTFSSLAASIFSPTCAQSGCHTQSTQASGLVLESVVAYENIVDVPSVQQPALRRIAPGDPEASYLIRKVRGDAGITGGQMPARGGPLSAAQIDGLIAWVAAGAPNN